MAAPPGPDAEGFVVGRLTTSQFKDFQKLVDAMPGGAILKCEYACDVPGCTAPLMKERALCRCGEHDVCSNHMAFYQKLYQANGEHDVCSNHMAFHQKHDQSNGETICQAACERILCELKQS